MTLRVYAHAVEGADRALAGALGDALKPTSASESVVRESKGMDVLSRLGVDRGSIDAFCRRNGVCRLAVFGSALRDDFIPDSDVDLLVEFEPDRRVSLFDMARHGDGARGARRRPPGRSADGRRSRCASSARKSSPTPSRCMTSPCDDDRVAHIVEACEQASSFVAGKTRDDLEHDRMLQLALVKLVEIIGEAAKAVSDDTRRRYPEVPWSLAARTRDRLTHHYFEPGCSGAL